MAGDDPHKELLSSLVSDIRNYGGQDPLRPWLRGIRRMRECLPPHTLEEKLPRFLQKCAQAFESDRRYCNDPRYLRVWIQLMDYVDDAKVVLRKMEKQRIGLKRAAFYIAYALYYEKRKKFENAEKMYHLGVHNLAEPASELQRSYEKFLHRMEMCQKRKAKQQEAIPVARRSTSRSTFSKDEVNMPQKNIEGGVKETEELTERNCHEVGPHGASQISFLNANIEDYHLNADRSNVLEGCSNPAEEGCKASKHCLDLPSAYLSDATTCSDGCIHHPHSIIEVVPGSTGAKKNFQHRGDTKRTTVSSDDTVVVKFVGSAIVGKSQAEDACHHGLVDPTINMKEAMNAISSMFREPLEQEPIVKRRLRRNKPQENQQSNQFEVFIDESLEGENLYNQKSKDGGQNEHHKLKNQEQSKMETEGEFHKPFVRAFEVYADDDDDDDEYTDGNVLEKGMEVLKKPTLSKNPLICSNRNDGNHTNYKNPGLLREDTVIRRFIGSTVFNEPRVENACHHGLVDPTINMKEAMDDINSMFGKPLDFVKANKQKKQGRLLDQKPNTHSFTILADDEREVPKGKSLDQKPVCPGFSILADDEIEDNPKGKVLGMKPDSHGFSILADEDTEQDSNGRASSSISCKTSGEDDLFEPTVFTKEALADINEMFGRPLDF